MNDSSLEKYRHDLAIVRETAAQVMKDFGVLGLEIRFSGDPFSAYEELKEQIAPVLFELFQNDRSRFQSLLYRIDLSESTFRKLLGENTPSNFSHNLADMILQREFQKVLTRRFFSK
ncbi:MAG: hypothetical protein IPQ03_01980 [Bacteroidetes bacterium]|nr:hypothetical protein [Bacteroidota bacterium]MBP6402701.1 hypothetical protein [Bacteroidia bacterium]MBK9524516.1 hypothetical protein [Bacteroidota bacterium]MBK9542124.1 hypothetical protein [Bacteroidota bacterium]MBL0256338.1 hypothetical protein [Bacteroidota bacterium]